MSIGLPALEPAADVVASLATASAAADAFAAEAFAADVLTGVLAARARCSALFELTAGWRGEAEDGEGCTPRKSRCVLGGDACEGKGGAAASDASRCISLMALESSSSSSRSSSRAMPPPIVPPPLARHPPTELVIDPLPFTPLVPPADQTAAAAVEEEARACSV